MLTNKNVDEYELSQIQFVRSLIKGNPMLDEDGYPTEAALAVVSNWTFSDPIGWFQFIRSIWYCAGQAFFEDRKPNKITDFRMSTVGWSGNEGIIKAMQRNPILWSNCWVQSRRGGHHVFEVKDE
jgi:hypothetical protein